MFGAPNEVLGEVVVAVVALKPGAAASQHELLAHARTLLSGYKVRLRALLGFSRFRMNHFSPLTYGSIDVKCMLLQLTQCC